MSVSSPGTYLIIENGVLKGGIPSGGNEEFQDIVVPNYHAYQSNNNPSCYIAFTQSGQVYGPCGLSSSDQETWIVGVNV